MSTLARTEYALFSINLCISLNVCRTKWMTNICGSEQNHPEKGLRTTAIRHYFTLIELLMAHGMWVHGRA